MNGRVVGADWVADHLEDDDLTVVDVREGWEYDGIGHIPGAVNISFDSFRADEHGVAEAGMLPGADAFAALLEEVGTGPEARIVAYDDTHGVFAARFLVTAELYGHDPERLGLLDGDFSSWQLEGPTDDETPTSEPTTYNAAFEDDGPLVGIETVEQAVDNHDTVIVDTREGWEYEEGHIPGAVCLDWRELVDDETRGIRPESELRTLLEERGIRSESRILLYCNTARRISHTYVALRDLGYDELAFYEGSLSEWQSEARKLDTSR